MNGVPTIAIAVEPIAHPTESAPRQPDKSALANLMIACAKGNMPTFTAGDMPQGPLGRRDASIRWRDQDGIERAFTLDVSAGQWDVENPPETGPQVEDAMGAIYKMLQAVSAGWPIRAFRPEPHLAVISWDRQSHDNHPALVLKANTGVVAFYYEAPDEYGTNSSSGKQVDE